MTHARPTMLAVSATLVLAILIAFGLPFGCAGIGGAASPTATPGTAATPPATAPDAFADSHLHIANYAMQGLPLKTFIDQYMGTTVARSTVFGIPLQQKWDRFERFAGDKVPPNYYLGPKAGLYYYSLVDAMLAMEYRKLGPADQARLDPMIVGFNPMDQYGAQHVRRMLLMFPGTFSGIGEFTIHKEIVSSKVEDDRIAATIAPGDALPPDATDEHKNSLYNPALKTLFDFAAESGLIVNLHSDIYPAKVTHDGKVQKLSPEAAYVPGMKYLCTESPNAIVYWAHTGLGRFVKPAPQHLEWIADVLDHCPNWNVDISWDLVQAYIVNPQPGMPTLADWARFITRYQDRVLWGSDTVVYTRNKIDDHGNVTTGKPMSVADYLAVPALTKPLWDAVGPDVARKVKVANHVRLFDAAKKKVRAWEAAHAQDDIWNLP